MFGYIILNYIYINQIENSVFNLLIGNGGWLRNKTQYGIKICKSPLYNEKYKHFSLWLRQVKTWKCATKDINGLKEIYGLQLALHLPEGESEGTDGWNAVTDLLKSRQ